MDNDKGELIFEEALKQYKKARYLYFLLGLWTSSSLIIIVKMLIDTELLLYGQEPEFETFQYKINVLIFIFCTCGLGFITVYVVICGIIRTRLKIYSDGFIVQKSPLKEWF